MTRMQWITVAWMMSVASSSGVELGSSPQWSVPLGGNAYLTTVEANAPDRIERGGIRMWQSEGSVFSVYFRVDRAADLDLGIVASIPVGVSVIRASVGERHFDQTIGAGDGQEIALGTVRVTDPGYLRVDLRGLSKSGRVFADVTELSVKSANPELKLDFVKDNDGSRFYWGRRGPSVHLSYPPPEGKAIEYFYSELRVPEGLDPIGSYFMANGFGEGYFGIQVNGPSERRVLFSVWSPFHTDDPKQIPPDQQIRVLARGDGVRTGEFGNEGSGGQSFLVYPWQAGATYRFLNRARPDGQGNTIYTAWFYPPEEGKWRLIASFLRPKTDKYLTGLHSFLENFSDRQGYLGRMSHHGNQWARDVAGDWHELTRARFTGDDIARRSYRLDYAGGVDENGFFMRNGGYFGETVKLDSRFDRQAMPEKKPVIDLEVLNIPE